MRLKEMRENAGLTQFELAEISGVNFRSLQDYEQGHKSIFSAKGDTLLRLSRSLGCSIEDILECDIHNMSDDLFLRRLSAYEKCILNRKNRRVHFPVIESDEKVDMSLVYPTKQRNVKRVLNNLRKMESVKGLYLFGSSITMACNRDSDIDFAVELRDCDLLQTVRNNISEKIQEACDWTADIIWIDHLNRDERIYNEIMRGIVLI